MATLTTTPAQVTVSLTTAERALGLIADQLVLREQLHDVEVVADGMRAVRGIRAPGFGLPRVAAIGTWRGRGYRDLVVVRRGQAAVVVTLSGHRYARLVVGVATPDEAERLADDIRPLVSAG